MRYGRFLQDKKTGQNLKKVSEKTQHFAKAKLDTNFCQINELHKKITAANGVSTFDSVRRLITVTVSSKI